MWVSLVISTPDRSGNASATTIVTEYRHTNQRNLDELIVPEGFPNRSGIEITRDTHKRKWNFLLDYYCYESGVWQKLSR